MSKAMSIPILIIIACLAVSEIGSASEAAAPHGEAADKDKAKNDAPVTTDKPWVEIENKMALLKSRREVLMAGMNKVREERDAQRPGTPEYKQKQDEYVKTHKDWKQVGEDFNRLLNQLKYRFPERVLKSSRIQTEAMQNKSVEELESELGIDGKLNRMMRKMSTIYGIKVPEPEAPRAPVERKGIEDSLTEEPQIIIRK